MSVATVTLVPMGTLMLPNGGTTTTIVSAGGGLDVMFPEGAGMLPEGAGTLVGNAVELGIGNGKRGASELVPIDAVLIVAFTLGLGVMLGTAGTVIFVDGTMLPVGSVAELGMGNGILGASEFVPIELKGTVKLELGLGVILGIAGTEEFEDGTGVPLLATIGADELGIGNGIRDVSELVPIELEGTVPLKPGLGVALGKKVTVIVVFVNGGAPLSTAGTDELGMGNGIRGASELVPIELEGTVPLKLGLGVALGKIVTVVVVFVNGSALLSTAGTDELGMGNGIRGASEFVPIELEGTVPFKVGIGVALGGTTTTVVFVKGNALLLNSIGADELGIGKGERGESEFVPVEPVLTVAFVLRLGVALTGVDMVIEKLAEGGMMPLLPVADETAVLPWTVKVVPPLEKDTSTLGVGARLGELMAVEFTSGGGITPDALVEKAVAIDPEVEEMRLPDDTVTFDEATGVELGGGISPLPPVDDATAVDPDVEKTRLPTEIVTLDEATGVELGGGISPNPPVEERTAVELDVEKIALPTLVLISMTGGGVSKSVSVVVDVKILETTAV
jgi:hypothetical protein